MCSSSSSATLLALFSSRLVCHLSLIVVTPFPYPHHNPSYLAPSLQCVEFAAVSYVLCLSALSFLSLLSPFVLLRLSLSLSLFWPFPFSVSRVLTCSLFFFSLSPPPPQYSPSFSASIPMEAALQCIAPVDPLAFEPGVVLTTYFSPEPITLLPAPSVLTQEPPMQHPAAEGEEEEEECLVDSQPICFSENPFLLANRKGKGRPPQERVLSGPPVGYGKKGQLQPWMYSKARGLQSVCLCTSMACCPTAQLNSHWCLKRTSWGGQLIRHINNTLTSSVFGATPF